MKHCTSKQINFINKGSAHLPQRLFAAQTNYQQCRTHKRDGSKPFLRTVQHKIRHEPSSKHNEQSNSFERGAHEIAQFTLEHQQTWTSNTQIFGDIHKWLQITAIFYFWSTCFYSVTFCSQRSLSLPSYEIFVEERLPKWNIYSEKQLNFLKKN